jgi:hypothetical protein
MSQASSSDGLRTGLDWSRPDTLSEEEVGMLERWYIGNHRTSIEQDSENLNRFLPFWVEERPDVVKAYRRMTEQSAATDLLPAAALGLLWLHWYAVLPSPAGVIYEIRASRSWGASRAQVVETLAFAFVHGGPHALGVSTDACAPYLQSWHDSERAGDDIAWPVGWSTDVSPLRSGVDLTTDGMTDTEVEQLRDWHVRLEGEVPAYVEYLARTNRTSLKAFRHRYETAFRGALPVQLQPLMRLQLAGIHGRTDAVRRAAHMARSLGVDAAIVEHTGAYLQFFLGDVLLDEAIRGLA